MRQLTKNFLYRGITLFMVILTSIHLFAQPPQSFKYQAVLRDASGQVLANENAFIDVSIVQGSALGTQVFSETHLITTNSFGLANLAIGSKQPAQFSTIDWSNGPYFVKINVDGVEMGMSELLSVPYALRAITAENDNVDDADADPTNEIQLLSIHNDTLFLSNSGFVKLPAGFDGHYSSLTGAPTTVSAFVNDAGYLTAEVDASITNELQVLSISNDTIKLSNGGYVKLPAGFDGNFNSLANIPANLDTDATDDFNGQYSSLIGAPTAVSTFTNDAGYLIAEVDGSITNELQVLSISNDTLKLSNGGFVKLPSGFNGQYSSLTGAPTTVSAFTNDAGYLIAEVDGSITNELQVLSISNDTIRLSNGGFVKLPAGFDGKYSSLTGTPTKVSTFTNDAGYLATEVDGSITNELQVLSISHDTLKLSNGGFVKLPAETDPRIGANSANYLPKWNGNALVTGSVYDNGNIGIGTASPDFKLQVNGDIVPETDGNLNLGSAGLGWDTLFMSSTLDYKNNMGFSSGGTERMTITSNGNVGIGATNPDAKLVVAGQIKITGGSPFSGRVLTSDVNGLATWRTPAGDGDSDPSNELQNLSSVLAKGNNGGSRQIKNILDPTNAHDAATKAYVDRLEARIAALEAIIASNERTWYEDSDTDGFGDALHSIVAITQPLGYTTNSLDCNDNNPQINPNADEICDGYDNDCNGLVDDNPVDCMDNDCIGGECIHLCDDGLQNGNETGIDCGGPDCIPCRDLCDDGIKNGSETAIDCGGPDCDPCPTCDDGLKNGNETGYDCGGPDCDPCICIEIDDCESGVCINGICQPCTCDDGIQDCYETGIDCGGPDCEPCEGLCDDGIMNGSETGIDCGGPDCNPCSTCEDGIMNGNETGIDCGGSCPFCIILCFDGIKNGDETGIDCGGSCTFNVCPTCDDGIINGDEEGIDCGGSECESCITCNDGIQNGDETGIDCGGSECFPCDLYCHNGRMDGEEEGIDCGGPYCTPCLECELDTDCPVGMECVNGICQPIPDCHDQIKNGNETEIDCGGPDCNPCPSCDDGIMNGDEDGIDCGAGCVSCEELCGDGILNGNETGIDCGGPDCPSCEDLCDDGILNGNETGIDCGGPDCGTCPTCDDGIMNGNETGVDCGGSCPPCPTCNDGVKNGDETGIDCGGSCPPCPTCDDGIMNGEETGIDCGGPNCNPCPTCDDGVMNGDETGIDCGGSDCESCPTCDDGILNGEEEGIDCGGPDCSPCEDLCGDGIKNGNETGIDCGGEHCEPCEHGTFTDSRDSHVYKWVKIGNQVWMAENLNYYTPAGSFYINNDSATYAATYGRLYNWPTAMAGEISSTSNPSLVQGVCPTGWHFPSVAEWTELTDYLGGTDVAGGKLKETGTTHWINPNPGATNESGFTALPGGGWLDLGYAGHWWSSTESSWFRAYIRYILNEYVNVFSDYVPKATTHISVRCVKNYYCDDGIMNGDETGIDCGGSCPPCPTCDDGVMNGDETGIDCGGSCPSCPTCDDGIMNGNETGIDCGGSCPPCPTCDDGIMNGDETWIDCGGSCPPCPTFTDSRDAHNYKWVKIGNLVWMAENLAYNAVGSWAYDNNESNVTTYGRLYNWATAMAGASSSATIPSGVQGVCPSGWHLPSDGEWTILTDFLGGESEAGGKLKEAGITHWQDPNVGATNETGFTAVPSGYYDWGGYFYGVTLYNHCWSSTEFSTANAWGRYFFHSFSNISQAYFYGGYGFSVRCIQDYYCDDIVKNGTETDVDCGGLCNKCGDNRSCIAGSDCASGVCENGVCQPPSCNDGIKNGSETGVDCGPDCIPCEDLCGDGIQNGSETGVDCGPDCDPCPTSGTFTDARDAQVYNWVKIGNQAWMAKNLAYLPSVVDHAAGSDSNPYYYVYDYNDTDVPTAKATANYTTYGVLYNWPAAMNEAASSPANPSGVQGVCPSGWHLPSDAEWTELKDFLTSDGHSGTEGTALTATSGWYSGGNGTDDYGFSGLPGGYLDLNGDFVNIISCGYWWSSTDGVAVGAWVRSLGSYDASFLGRYDFNKANGFSVRCVED